MHAMLVALALAALPAQQEAPPAEPAAPPAPVAPPAPAPDQLLVVLKPRVVVHQTPVRLGSVADLLGPAAQVARFARLELCAAPVTGKPRLVTPAGVRLAARLAGLELEKERVVGAPQVEIVAHWEELASDQLLAAAQQWIVARSEELGDRVLLEPAVRPDAIGLLRGGGAPTFEFAFVGKPRSGGPAQVKLSVFQDGALLGERVATFQVRRFGRQLRLLTNVRRGETIAPSQVVVIDGEWTNVNGTAVLEAAALAGTVATRDLAAGTVLVREAFELPLLVDRGGTVRVVLRDGALEIVATGVAQRAGRRGETIPVMNPGTQKLMQVQLVDKRPGGDVVALLR